MTVQLLLAALGHASPAAAVADGAALAATAAWLEDTKVRALPADARGPLRDAAGGEAWEAAFAQYLAAVGCPVAASARRDAVTWLAGHAVALEYADSPATYAPPRADGDAQRPDGGQDADDALNGVDDVALWAHVRSCAAALRGGGSGGGSSGAAAAPGGAVAEAASLAAAAAQLAWLAALPPDERSRAAAAAAAAADAPGSFPAGFAAPRPALARPAALLRACHVGRLRELQSRADAALVAAQEATANPRTDSKLGRVGR